MDGKVSSRNVVPLGAGFLLLFSAFNGVQVSLSALLGQHAAFSALAMLYAVFAVSNFLAPALVAVVGPKAAIWLGGAGYVSFCASLAFAATPMARAAVVAGGALVGGGAALLWCGHGTYMSVLGPLRRRGVLTGAFFSIFQGNQILGNATVALVRTGVPGVLTRMC